MTHGCTPLDRCQRPPLPSSTHPLKKWVSISSHACSCARASNGVLGRALRTAALGEGGDEDRKGTRQQRGDCVPVPCSWRWPVVTLCTYCSIQFSRVSVWTLEGFHIFCHCLVQLSDLHGGLEVILGLKRRHRVRRLRRSTTILYRTTFKRAQPSQHE